MQNAPAPLCPNRRLHALLLLCAVAGSSAGCAFTQRVVLLKEFSPSVPQGLAPQLTGRRVTVEVIDRRLDVEVKWTGTDAIDEAPDRPTREMAKWETERWDQERDAVEATTPDAGRTVIGWMRNGFGMHTANVVAINSPAQWLGDAIAMELGNQGATIVPPAERDTADLQVEATIRYMKVDIYMINWADLVVDLRITPRNAPPFVRTVHTMGKQVAFSTSGYEFYRCFRRCEQLLVWEMLADVERVLRAVGQR